MCDVVLGKTESYTIGGVEYPSGVVKHRFMQLDSSHLQYVIERITGNYGEIRNMHILTAV